MAFHAPQSDLVDADTMLSHMAIFSGDEAEGDMIPLHVPQTEPPEESDSTSDLSASPSRKPALPRSRAKKARKSAHQTQETKPLLRPAKDILSRIRHDPALDESEFIVGYKDRLEGLLEMDVSAWNKEGDFTDEEWIPQHRIQYFRRRGEEPERRVWDRESRLDRLFGSGVLSNKPEQIDKPVVHEATSRQEDRAPVEDGSCDSSPSRQGQDIPLK